VGTTAPACLFCGIASGLVPSDQVYADDEVVAFRDIHPQAPLHVLVIPRQHIEGISSIGPEHAAVLARLLQVANRIAGEQGAAESGYRLVFNSGPDAGQSIFHLHLHVLGKRKLHWPPG